MKSREETSQHWSQGMLASGGPIREHLVLDGVIMLQIRMALLQPFLRTFLALILNLKSYAMMCVRMELLLALHTFMAMPYVQQHQPVTLLIHCTSKLLGVWIQA